MAGKKVSLEVDAAVNAAYLRFSDQPIESTIEIAGDVQVDVDAAGTIVGVELLDLASGIPIHKIAAQFDLGADQESILRQMRSALSTFVTTASSRPGTADALLAAAG